jgi:hypothetical protein
MCEGNWTDFVTAGGTAVAALMAVIAAATWRKGLENKRVDDAISAVHELQARINRVVAIAGDKRHVWGAYTDAWNSWSLFNAAYVVAQRYHHCLSKSASNDFVNYLNELKGVVESIPEGEDADSDKFKSGTDDFKRKVDDLVKHRERR